MRPLPLLPLLSVLLLTGCARRDAVPAPSGSPSAQVSLFVTADLRGYLGPCGCSQNMRGGIGRAAAQILEARGSGRPVLFFDAGDSLFPHASLPPEARVQEELKARTLAAIFAQSGLSARASGEKDGATALRASLALPEIAEGAVRSFDAGGRQVAAVAASTPEQLARAARSARAQGAQFVLGLFHGTIEQARAAADTAPEVDLVVASHSDGELLAEENRSLRGQATVAQLQSKGRSLLRVDLLFGGQGRFFLHASQAERDRELAALDERMELLKAQIASSGLSEENRRLRQAKLEELVSRRQNRAASRPEPPVGVSTYSLSFLPLEAVLPSDPKTEQRVLAYDREVGQLNLDWARQHGSDCPPAAQGLPAFVGNGPCLKCHPEAMSSWSSSRHATAFATLERVGKQHHLDCVGCHVTGAEQPGGVCRLDKLEGRKDVGCESCHGPGSLHSASRLHPIPFPRPGREVCASCHTGENSPHFDFATYLPKVVGPGHGAPKASASSPGGR